jgi:hypothetical protein
MFFRLGQYECPSCGRIVSAPAPVALQARDSTRDERGSAEPLQNSSGPLLHREENSYGGGWTPPSAAVAPAAPERLFNLGGDPPETFFDSDKHGLVKEQEKSVEKKSFFGLCGLWAAIGMVLSFSGGAGGATIHILFSALALFIIWAVLHSDELWPKWAMAGLVALSWLLFAGSFVAPDLGLASLIGKLLPFASRSEMARLSSIGVTVLLDFWFLALLFRDIRKLNADT